MTSKQIRAAFLEFFRNKQHDIVSSAPIVVKDDPTLMFTNAGMNQFKDIFLGNKKPKSLRVANTQKCLRVSGKHNDLEEVGIDTYHHTMFEMLGNWSFGDYFKKESIDWAWEFLTNVVNLEKERLYATVFEGSAEENLEADEEALQLWTKYLPKERVLFGSKKDNFWEMGESGPCGPCSEIHVDLRDESERKKIDGRDLVNKSHPQVVEIWNLVFIQFNRNASGKLEKLPKKYVDTGMGFERLCMALQGKKSNYDTDIFQPIISEIASFSKKTYGSQESSDIAMRVIADHVRAVAFTIADGQLPDREGAGYVVRRILRRAVRYGYSYLNQKEAFIYKLLPVLRETMGEQFPELKTQEQFLQKVVREEEDNFLKTLERGIVRLNNFMETAADKTIPGQLAFELFDTYGFPIDLTQLIARENNFHVDLDEFSKYLQQQKERSRKAAARETEDWVWLKKDVQTQFVGYDEMQTEAQILGYRKVKTKDKEFFQIVLDKTPFYPEGGGQVGDVGILKSNGDQVKIFDTKRENETIVHFAEKLPRDVEKKFTAAADTERRSSTVLNHSATHLLHEALREVLGKHVEQRGSLVHPEYLRFDFSHFQKMTEEEIAQVEQKVNERIRANFPLDEKRKVPFAQAKEMGAMALFGEKYGDEVRVIRFGNSVELCGGTHTKATGDIGVFKIVSESGVAAGIRRIEALTGQKALDFFNEKLNELKLISGFVKSQNVVAGVENILKENQRLTKELQKMQSTVAGNLKEELKNGMEPLKNGINYIGKIVEVPSADALKDLSYQLKNDIQNLFLVLGTNVGGKPFLSVMIDEKLVKEKNLNAGNIVRELAKEIQGGGGGQPFFATAGGKDADGLEKAMEKARRLFA